MKEAGYISEAGLKTRMKEHDMTDKAREMYEKRLAKVKPGDEEKIRKKFPKAVERLPDGPTGIGWLDKLIEQIKLLYEMLFDPEFVISWQTKAKIIAALAYFISPIDVVPDYIPVAGWADDALVVMFAIHSISEDVARYAAFKKEKGKKARAAKAKPATKKSTAAKKSVKLKK